MTNPPLDLTPIELLSTTRSVRQRLDLTRPVPRDLIEKCVEIAIQAPTGSNLQGWQFLIIDDPERKAKLAEYYRRSHARYRPMSGRPVAGAAEQAPARLRDSVDYLAEHLHEVPVLVMPLLRGRLRQDATDHERAGFYGSILPAVWSFMLAARLHGLGTTFTTMHLRFEQAVADDFGVPYDKVTQIALVPVAFYTGDTFAPAARHPVGDVVHWNTW
jgi:nitroreductase